jgi:hypothetical protein
MYETTTNAQYAPVLGHRKGGPEILARVNSVIVTTIAARHRRVWVLNERNESD